MPRLPTSRILQAYQRNPLLPLLLRECRTLISAQNELRWIREHAISVIQQKSNERLAQSPVGWRSLLRSMCKARSRGVPLQYILGDQPFGELEILCRKGVLIPRPETESYTMRAADIILSRLRQNNLLGKNAEGLRILDLCSGTGCISLLLHALLAPHVERLSILGIDFSPTAIDLSKKNLKHNQQQRLLSARAATEVSFKRGDVLGTNKQGVPSVEQILHETQDFHNHDNLQCDVLISNPPYISNQDFRNGTTARSVRHFEPKLALVPARESCPALTGSERLEDIFYHRIVSLSFKWGVKLLVLECGNRLQGQRVETMCQNLAEEWRLDANKWSIEIWSDAEGEQDMQEGACTVIMNREI